MAVQEGLISIRVSWSPPTPLGNTTGYRIDYSNGHSNGSVDVSGGSTDNYLVTGLQNGDSYTISIVATSQHLPSQSVEVEGIGLRKFFCFTDDLSYITCHSHSSRPAKYQRGLHNTHLHLPLRECAQWHSGGQL